MSHTFRVTRLTVRITTKLLWLLLYYCNGKMDTFIEI